MSIRILSQHAEQVGSQLRRELASLEQMGHGVNADLDRFQDQLAAFRKQVNELIEDRIAALRSSLGEDEPPVQWPGRKAG